MKYKKNFEKCTPFATSALLTTRVRPCVEEGRTLDFKQEYFSIWQEVWTLHKKYFGIRQQDEQRWQLLDRECEALDAKYKGTSEQVFLQSLLLAVTSELEKEREE